MKICIGIVSYFPENNSEVRLQKLRSLLTSCDTLFELPIMIIAQNWGKVELPEMINSKLIIYNYKDKLGITGARRELRKYFLESEYDYIIMLDDDAILNNNKYEASKYLEQIENHPNMFGVFKGLILKLSAISKHVWEKIPFPPGEVCNGDYFEDMYLIMAAKKLYPNEVFEFNRNKFDTNTLASEFAESTWYFNQINKHDIGDRTRKMISQL